MSNKNSEANQSMFFQDAIKAFGRDDTEALGTTIIQSINDSEKRLPLLRPMAGLKLMVCDGEGFGGFATYHEGAMELYFGRDSRPGEAVEQLPRIIEHEYAHIAHGQHNPNFREGYDKRHMLFAAAITEGIARHAEFMQADAEYDPNQIMNDHPRRVARVMQVLHEILHRLPENRLPKHYEFLFGDTTFRGRGYNVGHYVVASMAVIEDCSLEQLMEKSLDEFEYFIGVE